MLDGILGTWDIAATKPSVLKTYVNIFICNWRNREGRDNILFAFCDLFNYLMIGFHMKGLIQERMYEFFLYSFQIVETEWFASCFLECFCGV